jgi:hypothetical protein
MADELPPAFFTRDGDGYVGTVYARGPWDDGTAHGGPVAALIGREVERFDPDPDLATVRFSLELLRPVPLAHLRLETTMLRPGKRVRLIGVSVLHEGTEVVRATALRILRVPDDAPRSTPDEGIDFPGPEHAGQARSLIEGRIGITDAVELLTVKGSAVEPGPATYWFRVHVPLVDDEPITPLTRALIAADFGNGIASVVSIATHVFINPDLTVHLHRLPEGEWVANDARTWMEPGGVALAEAVLADQTGPIGRAMQSVYVASR